MIPCTRRLFDIPDDVGIEWQRSSCSISHRVLEQVPVKARKPRVNQPPDNDVQTFDYAFAFCFAAQRAFIKSDNFFLAAALIAGRAFGLAEAAFFGADLRFHFAQRCFMASEIRLRAEALMCRPVVAAAFDGRPRRAGESTPSRAAMAWSMRVRSSLRASTTFAMSMESFPDLSKRIGRECNRHL